MRYYPLVDCHIDCVCFGHEAPCHNRVSYFHPEWRLWSCAWIIALWYTLESKLYVWDVFGIVMHNIQQSKLHIWCSWSGLTDDALTKECSPCDTCVHLSDFWGTLPVQDFNAYHHAHWMSPLEWRETLSLRFNLGSAGLNICMAIFKVLNWEGRIWNLI